MARSQLVGASIGRALCLAVVCTLAGSVPAEEALPAHAIARLGGYQFYHGPGVSAAISPDGSRVASVSWEGYFFATDREREAYERIVVIWDSATGERLRELQVPHAPAAQPRFSSDGKLLAVSFGRGDKLSGIAVYDVATGKLQTRIDKRALRFFGFAGGGKSLLFDTGFGEPLIEWDLANAKPARQWKQPAGPSEWIKGREYVWQTIQSADAKHVAWLVDDPPDYSKVKLAPGELVDIPPHVPRPTVLVMSDGPTGKPLYRKEFLKHSLDQFTFSGDGKRFAIGGEKVTIYETATGKELFAIDTGSVYSLALSPDGRWMVTNSGWSEVRLWNLETKKLAYELFSGLAVIPSHADFSADGKSLVLVTLSTIRLFDTTTGKERLTLGHRTGVTPRFSADGKTLFTTCDELRRTWDVSDLKKPILLNSEPRKAWERISGHFPEGFSPDGRLFVDDVDRRLRIRDASTGKVLHTIQDEGWSGSFAVFSPDGGRVALRRYRLERTPDGGISSGTGTEVLHLYNTTTGVRTGDIALKNGLSWVVPAFSADGKMLAWVDHAKDAHIHDAATGKLIRTLHSKTALPKERCNEASLLFSPDGSHLIVSTGLHDILKRPNGSEWVTLPTRVFDVASGKEVTRFYTNPTTTNTGLKIACAACSPDGRLFATAEVESGTVRLFEIAKGKLLSEFAGHRHGVHALAFSPDGKSLASGGEDAVAYLWDVTNVGLQKEPKKKN